MLRATEEIKQKLSIVDVIGEYVKLERAGNYFKARCPFHSEKTPSFHVSPDRGTYYCFGCGAKGDIFDFIEQFEGQDFKGALTMLASKAGVTLSKQDIVDKTGELFIVLEKATEFFELSLSKNPEVFSYLKERGVEESSIKTFRIGFAPDSWSALYEYLKKAGFSDRHIETVGLAKVGEKGGMYDRFRNRIMFPIADSLGRVIGFSGRALDKNETAKYINSPETPLYSKSKILYGFDKAKQSIRKKDYTIVVEGQFDLVLSHQEGLTNTVAVSGTAFTTSESLDSLSHLGVLKRLSSNIVFAFDGDVPGLGAAWKATKAAFAIGMDVKILKLSQGTDPADVLSKSPQEFKDALKSAERAIPFFCKHIMEDSMTERNIAKAIEEKIIPLIQVIPSAVNQSVAISEASKVTGFKTEVIERDVFRKEGINVKEEEKIDAPKLSLEDKIFGLLFYKESKGENITEALASLETTLGKDLFTDSFNRAKGFKEELLYLTDILYTQHDTSERDHQLLSNRLARELIRKKLRDNAEELSKIRSDNPRYEELLKESQMLSEKLKAITIQHHAN